MQDASHKQRIRQADEASQELKQHIETLVREKNHAQEKLQNVRDVKQREFQVSARLHCWESNTHKTTLTQLYTQLFHNL